MTILLLRTTTFHGTMRRYRLQRVPVPLFADLPFGERLVGVTVEEGRCGQGG